MALRRLAVPSGRVANLMSTMSLPVRSDHHAGALASPGTVEFDDQRLLLLELLVDPPAEGDAITKLATVLGRSAAQISTAAAALTDAGLAECRDGYVRASGTARAFDALWPICL
jgi:hypothetical protein